MKWCPKRTAVCVLLAVIPNVLLYLALSHLNTLTREAITREVVPTQVLRVAPAERPAVRTEKPKTSEEPAPSARIVTVDMDAARPEQVTVAPVPLNAAPAAFIPRMSQGLTSGGIPFAEDVDDMPGEISTPRPAYPASARRLGQEGMVVVKLLITESGTVEDAVIMESQGPDSFRRAVLDAVRMWRYQPARQAGIPVRVWGIKRVRFELEDL
ncbi:MAG: energy transducer TonB [Pontiellaceae bacterium]|nr:energy transducer TonB [Pontiellaceae bacterium]